ncbi:hypothetical protein B0H34DRAFT_667702 [Crassisporium funariophilum]|nr:hypothetical protein B0H34DRAFT_667702 [Crassisporium funariophilum]
MPTSRPDILREPVGIIGAGPAGLINAHVLLQDGFTDVTLITRDKSVGGTWMRDRIYPGLYINSVHGEYSFSPMDMPQPEMSPESGDRLSGLNICDYMETFAERFLIGKAKLKYDTEVLNIDRDAKGVWKIAVKDPRTNSSSVMTFSRIILATGGSSHPNIPSKLCQEAADKEGFQGLVVHSEQFAIRLGEVLASVKPSGSTEGDKETVLVIGGGKSAQDICAKLAKEGRKVTIVTEKLQPFNAGPKPSPDFIRKSRLISVLSPTAKLNTRLERFLHTSAIGGAVVRLVWRQAQERSFKAYNISNDSPLRNTYPLFWAIHSSDEGTARSNTFAALATAGAINIISARAVGYGEDGRSVLLSNGQVVETNVVVLATGYQSSWTNIFTPATAEELGITTHIPTCRSETSWNYNSLKNPPPPIAGNGDAGVTSIYRGLIPAKNLHKRDFAIAGGLFVVNFTYPTEVAAHWVSSYFQGDEMRLPLSQEEALKETEEHAAWVKIRYPDVPAWGNLSGMTRLHVFAWPQVVDELLEDMYLPSMRSGGNWFNWAFKVINLKEIASLGDERRAKREASSMNTGTTP